eukprot:TRINITY_DN11421_c0_g1_i1.p1 TRINITY_DN11421_c0_g1~~TRINITY_DN11421_c0_g1_i1.p1  ORF type:complete len:661 (-),score=109.60 TRINITY_DN11421_c0_g1_i1:52-2034(-)
MKKSKHCLWHDAAILTTVVLFLTSLTFVKTKGRVAEAVERQPSVKALRSRLTHESIDGEAADNVATLARISHLSSGPGHQHDHSFSSCGTSTHKGVVRSYGKDQPQPRFEDQQCLETICDDPAIVIGYVDQLQNGRIEKVTARVKVYSIADDDFSRPFSDGNKTAYHKKAFDAYFKGANIDFVFEEFLINSTFLRNGEITPYDCPIEWLGDGEADWSCLHQYNGYDDGDWLCDISEVMCDPVCTLENIILGYPGTEVCDCICFDYRECQPEMIGDGNCDDICNVAPKDYDGGDCCLDPGPGKCYDPSKPLFQRSFADISEIREYVQSNFSTALYIYVGSLWSSYTAGISVFPWSIDFGESDFGGFLMDEWFWKEQDDEAFYGAIAAHELGHSLGLWHTFHGVTELNDDCLDPCYEAQYPVGAPGTMLKGDLCADTRPTPLSYECNDPEPCPSGVSSLMCEDCDKNPWVNTPIENLMGYSIVGEDCHSFLFSPQQFARMRCYYDLYYSDWDESPLPGQIVLPPISKRLSPNLIQVTWNTPLNKGSAGQLYYILRRSPSFPEGDVIVNATVYNDTAVTSHGKYSYIVKAGNDAGQSPYFVGVLEESPSFAEEEDDDERGLSTGAIVGLVLGCVAFVVSITTAAIFSNKNKTASESTEMASVA